MTAQHENMSLCKSSIFNHTLVFHQCSKRPQCIYILFLTIFDQFFVLSVLNFSLFENLNFTFDETKAGPCTLRPI